MKSKLKIIVPLALVLAGGAYKFVLAKPPAGPPPKIDGQVYILPKEFQLNLDGGSYAKLGVALVLAHDQAIAAAGGHEAAAAPPEGFGTLPQEAVVRDIVTDTITGVPGDELVSRKGREELKKSIVKELRAKTDVKVEDVLFTDVAVQ